MNEEQCKTLLREVEKKNSWGKNELKELILNILLGVIK